MIDFGARDRILANYLPAQITYISADVAPGCDHILNLEERLPFSDKNFDFVVALDVLEHVDNFHLAIRELFRVAHKRVVIALPNMSYIEHRLSFLLFGKLATDKYDLSPQERLDRHRWLTTYTTINATIETIAKSFGAQAIIKIDEIGSSTHSRIGLYPIAALHLLPRALICGRVIHIIELL